MTILHRMYGPNFWLWLRYVCSFGATPPPEAGAKLYSLLFASFIVMTSCLPSQVTLAAYLRSHPKASALRVKHRDATLYRTLRDAGMLEAALASSEA